MEIDRQLMTPPFGSEQISEHKQIWKIDQNRPQIRRRRFVGTIKHLYHYTDFTSPDLVFRKVLQELNQIMFSKFGRILHSHPFIRCFFAVLFQWVSAVHPARSLSRSIFHSKPRSVSTGVSKIKGTFLNFKLLVSRLKPSSPM